MRLTIARKDEIIRKVIDFRLKEQREQLEEMKAELKEFRVGLGELRYQHAFDPEDFKIIQSLPDGWLVTTQDVWVKYPDGSQQRWDFNEYRPVPYKWQYGRDAVRKIPANCPVLKEEKRERELEKVVNVFSNAINDTIFEIRTELRKILNSVTTVKKLLTVWPEGKQFMPEEAQTMAIAVQTDKLNSMLGLGDDSN